MVEMVRLAINVFWLKLQQVWQQLTVPHRPPPPLPPRPRRQSFHVFEKPVQKE